jgi:FkbM family methyltransferase
MKKLLKTLRVTQPINYLASSGLKAAMDLAGTRSDWVMSRLPRVGEVRAVLPDGKVLRLWSRGDEWICNAVFWRGLEVYEPETRDVFYRLAKHASVVLDVGAHIGVYSILAAFANPECAVYAFEPLTVVHERLQRHLAINQVKNVTCVAAAAGAVEGTADFYHAPLEYVPSASSLSREFLAYYDDKLMSCRVSVMTLDSFAEKNGLPRVDLVKIDTETTEPDVLSGMARILERDHPAIVCEVLGGQGTGQALEGILGPLGYRYYQLAAEGPLLRRRIEGHEEWRNYLFTTSEPAELAGILGP